MAPADKQTLLTPLVLAPGAGREIADGPTILTIKLSGDDTGGWSALEARCDPYTSLHTHAHEDEALYILEGTLQVHIGDTVFTAPAGSLIFLPRGLPTIFANPFAGRARWLGIVFPAGSVASAVLG